MKGLQILNAVLLALAATFFLTLGVVWLIYGFYLDAAPRMRGEWTVLGRVVIVFLLLMLCAGATFIGHRRAAAWRWPAQGLLAAALALGTLWLVRILA